jgi:4-hydroxyphenylpyruvate dioxygenase
MVGNVGWNEMNTWVKFYEEVMGFVNFLSFDDKQITTEYSALMSKVCQTEMGRIKSNENLPKERKIKSKNTRFLRRPGIHAYRAADDIIKTVINCVQRWSFIAPPIMKQFQNLGAENDERPRRNRKISFMVDADEEGYLLQIFTVQIEPCFLKYIQRMGAKGFGG